MRPLMSWSVAKLALPMTRLSIMRPATVAFTALGSISSLDFPPQALWSSPARCSRRKSFGNAVPRLRISASLARRSAMIWFSSCGGPSGGSFGGSFFLLMAVLHAVLTRLEARIIAQTSAAFRSGLNLFPDPRINDPDSQEKGGSDGGDRIGRITGVEQQLRYSPGRPRQDRARAARRLRRARLRQRRIRQPGAAAAGRGAAGHRRRRLAAAHLQQPGAAQR